MGRAIGYLTLIGIMFGSLTAANYVLSMIGSGINSWTNSSRTSSTTLKQEVMSDIIEERPFYFGNQEFNEELTKVLYDGEQLIKEVVSDEDMKADAEIACKSFADDNAPYRVVYSVGIRRFGYDGLYVTRRYNEGNAGSRYAQSLVKTAARRNCYEYYEKFY